MAPIVKKKKLWKILKETGIPGHLTFLLRNLYEGQKATVRTGYVTTDWLQIGKGVFQGCILSPCLFNLYTEYIIQHAGLDEVQAGIKIVGRNVNDFRSTVWKKSYEKLSILKRRRITLRKKVHLIKVMVFPAVMFGCES